MDFSGWEKLSLLDYDDNITTTLFMAGCPFRCPFCHNADLVLRPNEAPKIPFSEILEYLEKRKGVLDAVCISGGEPTLMEDLEDKIRAIKKLGYLVKLDSNGWRPKVLRHLIEEGLLDYVAMDIKNRLPKYHATCGVKVDLEQIQESIALLKEGKVDYEFRTTLISEFHDDGDIEEMANLIHGAKRYFLQMYIDSDHCIIGGFHRVPKEKALQWKEIFAKHADFVALRGYD